MYTTHFLQGEHTLKDDVRRVVEHTISKVCRKVGKDLNIDNCEVFVAANAKKIPQGDMFLGFSYDQAGVYLFVRAEILEQKITSHRELIEQEISEHVYRSLYTTARARHMNLGADCGLLEEVVSEGLSETFVTEMMSSSPKKRYVQFSDEEISAFWKRMGAEFDSASPDIERWFLGSEHEGIPPFTACSIGFAVAGAYLTNERKGSTGALTTPAKDIAVLQNRY